MLLPPYLSMSCICLSASDTLMNSIMSVCVATTNSNLNTLVHQVPQAAARHASDQVVQHGHWAAHWQCVTGRAH
jgi:hypothetical protein